MSCIEKLVTFLLEDTPEARIHNIHGHEEDYGSERGSSYRGCAAEAKENADNSSDLVLDNLGIWFYSCFIVL